MNAIRLLALSCALAASLPALNAAGFTPLTPLPQPRIVGHAAEYPGNGFPVAALLDDDPRTEYSSDGKGTNTFVEFAFPAPTAIGAFRHVDRNDPATIAKSELVCFGDGAQPIATFAVPHVNTRGGETFFALPKPVTVQRIRWRVTALGPQGHGTVGGSALGFYAAGPTEPSPQRDRVDLKPLPLLRKDAGGVVQPLRFTLHHPYAEPVEATLEIEGNPPRPVALASGDKTLDLELPAVDQAKRSVLTLSVAGQTVFRTNLVRDPVRPLTVHILPHSHTDIGYTEIQTAIEKKQVDNLLAGIEHARRTASYPEGARFVWNVEVLWAADLYLHRLDDAQRAAFLEAVRNGQVALCGMYLNELTGLCRPEELVRLFRFATELAARTQKPIDSVMISDVPGYTWGTVTAMTHAGLRYFSTAPNYFDRIGTILREWENKPFYWVGPDGRSEVLVWIPFWGYAMSHRYGKLSLQLVEDFCDGLAKRQYPYDVAHVRWSGHGDNAVPDPAICDFVRDWNARYASPRFIISSTSDAFRALESRYGPQLPRVRGDWTPYWEDGAGSSALETALNRASADRVAQAETVFALRQPRAFPPADFTDAWNNVLLYSEHTWGAWCSVSAPERKETVEQWEIKRSYAGQADRQSRALIERALAAPSTPASSTAVPVTNAFDVVNTLSWSRSGLVTVPPDFAAAGDRIADDAGQPVPSQRLRSDALVFLARDLPPLATRRYTVSAGAAHVDAGSPARAAGATLENGLVRIRIDEQTGGIVELTARDLDGNFADTSTGEALNDYLYLPGDDLSGVRHNGPVTLRPGEAGPLVASVLVESTAPGCRRLIREIRVVAGQDHVELINTVDKERLAVKSYMAKEGKESVNFGFAFRVPGGEIVLDLPLGRMRPEADQMPSACKNWFTIGRFADVSNAERGVTWVSLDAPLLQVGGLTANLLNSQTNPDVWRRHVGGTQRLYCWAMNNHWGTNYRAYQDGPVVFRFMLRPHRHFNPADASRFATAFSQPLLPTRAVGLQPSGKSLFTLDSPDVLLSALKPSDDGRALIVRLFGAGTQTAHVTLNWGTVTPKSVNLSDTSERPGALAGSHIEVPPLALVTLRLELE
jgi:hypothetical protein